MAAFRRDAVIELAPRETSNANELWLLTARQLRRFQDHGLLLGKNAQEQVAWFLLDMVTHMPPGHVVNFPMTRADIAEYLGLTIETVSRTLTQLENETCNRTPDLTHRDPAQPEFASSFERLGMSVRPVYAKYGIVFDFV